MLNDAVIIGRAHRLIHQNCHDTVYTGSPHPGCAFGLVLDGCGSKYRDGRQASHAHSEVGAKLLGQFVATFLNHRLASVGAQSLLSSYPLAVLLDDLHQECLAFLRTLINCYSFASAVEQARFLATHLLCTLVGFVITLDEALFFWSGDGFLCTAEEVLKLDQHNHPDYLAYQLLSTTEPREAGSLGFRKTEIVGIDEMEWLAVATDGWNQALLQELATPRPGLGLQRWVNVQARKRGTFDDDGAVAVWRRMGDRVDSASQIGPAERHSSQVQEGS
jgi:hypothetical protein